jgi:hypothetical protein
MRSAFASMKLAAGPMGPVCAARMTTKTTKTA